MIQQQALDLAQGQAVATQVAVALENAQRYQRTKELSAKDELTGLANRRSFLSAAREVAMNKPIIVIKAGRTEAAAKAATSHTGALTGSDEVLDAAFRRSGVLVPLEGDEKRIFDAVAKPERRRHVRRRHHAL